MNSTTAEVVPVIQDDTIPVLDIHVDGAPMLAAARAMTILAPADRIRAGDLLSEIAAARKRVVAGVQPIKRWFDERKRIVLDAEKAMMAPLDEAEAILKREIARDAEEQRRIAAEAQRRAEAEARRRHAEELARVAEENTRRVAEAEAARKADEAERLAEASALAEMGLDREADEALDAAAAAVSQPVILEAAPPPPVVVMAAAPPPASPMRDHWTATVTDPDALYRAGVDNPMVRACWEINPGALNRLAALLRDTGIIPGVAIRNEPVVVAKARR